MDVIEMRQEAPPSLMVFSHHDEYFVPQMSPHDSRRHQGRNHGPPSVTDSFEHI
jgi:hypothetical protein